MSPFSAVSQRAYSWATGASFEASFVDMARRHLARLRLTLGSDVTTWKRDYFSVSRSSTEVRILLACAAFTFLGCGASPPTLTSRAQATCAPSMCPFVGLWESSTRPRLFIDGDSLFAFTGWTQLIDPDVCVLTQQHGLYRHRLALHEGELRASICWVARRFRIHGEHLIDADGTVFSRADEPPGSSFLRAVATGDFGEELGRMVEAP